MYDELIKNLRHDSASALQNCEFDFVHAWMLEAADAIEELAEERDMYIKAMADEHNRAARLAWEHRWIPVTERLPEDRQRVLAISLPKIRPRSSYYRLVYFSNNLESVDNFDFEGESRCGFYYYDSEYGFCEVDDVTHWMPLPEPPESEET